MSTKIHRGRPPGIGIAHGLMNLSTYFITLTADGRSQVKE
jgi:hypothetical protein